MKKILSAALAVSLIATAGAATAAPRDNRQPPRVEQFHKKPPAKVERKVERQESRYERRAAKRFKASSYKRPAGYQARHWRHGERLPASYRGQAYKVDAHRYGLPAAPRGYQYTRVDNDVVLTAIATGVIASVIIGLFQ